MNQKLSKKIFILLNIIALIIGLISLQKKQLLQTKTTEEKVDYLEKEKHLKAEVKLLGKLPAFGFDNLLANWNYLQFLQYFGDTEARNVTGYSVVTDYFESIVDRDPNFIQSHLTMSSANSLFAARPEKTIELIDKVLESVTPQTPGYPFFLWTYKATDEILFLGDLEAAENSYKMAAKWASMRNDELGEEMSDRYRTTAQFLATNPNSTDVQIKAWIYVLEQASDLKTQQQVINKLESLGVDVFITEEGQIKVIEKDQA